MVDQYDVVIIGGGVIGCASAYYLAKDGVKALVIERDGIGAHASGYAAGGLNPLEGKEIPGLLGPIAMESYRMHLHLWDNLRSETGVDFNPRLIPMISVAFQESQLHVLREKAKLYENTEGFSGVYLDSACLYKTVPKLASGMKGGVYTYGNAALDSYRYTVALAQGAKQRGAEIYTDVVTGLNRKNGRVTSVITNEREILCEKVVLAMGPWFGQLEAWLDLSVPIVPLRGEILRMDAGEGLHHDLADFEVSLFSRRGLIWIGTTEENCGFNVNPSANTSHMLIAGALKLVPSMRNARLVKHTVCLRPVTPDWLPLIGLVPDYSNVFLATGAGKKGILLSTALGRSIADLVTLGTTNLPVDAFEPGRFDINPC